MLRLVDRADVFVQSLRPGLAERLGLGADELRGRNARLVYCSIGAYGHVGPLAEEPGYDALMQAAGGLISMTGEPGRPGVRVGSSLIDMGTGMWAALGVAAALLERERTGAGAVVDTSLYETALGYIGYHLVGYLADGTVPTAQGTVFPMVAPYQVFPTRDGELMVAGGNDRLFALLCEVLELPELVTTSASGRTPIACETVKSSSSSSRSGFASATRRSGASGSRPRVCPPRRSPTSPTSRAPSRPQALGFLQHVEHAGDPGAAAARAPALLRPRARDARLGAAAVGEHTAEILEEVGYSADEIAALARDGIIRTR